MNAAITVEFDFCLSTQVSREWLRRVAGETHEWLVTELLPVALTPEPIKRSEDLLRAAIREFVDGASLAAVLS